MKIRIPFLASIAVFASLSGNAAQDQLLQPVKVTAHRQIAKECFARPGWGPALSRADMMRGFGRPWTDDMDTLRLEANKKAMALCQQGYEGVNFTFISGAGRNLAITTGSGDATRVAATP